MTAEEALKTMNDLKEKRADCGLLYSEERALEWLEGYVFAHQWSTTPKLMDVK